MKSKIQHFLLFFILLHSSWSYDIYGGANHKLSAGNIQADVDSPTISNVRATSPCTIRVTWTCDTCPTTFDGFNIYWQQTGLQETDTAHVTSKSTFYEIEDLISDQSYTVWVASVLDGEESSSDTSDASTDEGEPLIVTGVTTKVVSDTVITVSWAETSNECPIQGYSVTWNGTSIWDPSITSVGRRETDNETTTIDAAYLTPYTDYFFYVREITTDGLKGEYSESSNAATEQGAADPPTPVTSTTINSTNVEVTWSTPYMANGVITAYHISCQLLPNTTDQCDVTTESEEVFSYTVTDLLACGNYTFNVQAINEDGDLGESGTDTSRTDSEVPPPIELLSEDNFEATNTTANITWTPLDTNCPVLVYTLQLSGIAQWNKTVTDTINREFTGEDGFYFLDDLIPYTSYTLTLEATTEGGTSDPASAVFETLQGVAEAPTYINASNETPSSVLLNWSPPLVINGVLQGYKISCKKGGLLATDECRGATTGADELSYTATELDACEDYTFTVQAITGDEEEEEEIEGEEATVDSTTDTEGPDPFDLNVLEVTSTTITINLTKQDTSCPFYYDVKAVGVVLWSGESIDYSTTLEGGDDTYVLDGFTPYTNYSSFNFTAYNEVGSTSSFFEEFIVITNASAPSRPTAFRATDITSTEVELEWGEPTNQNGESLGVYQLSYSLLLGNGNHSRLLSNSLTSYTLGSRRREKLFPCRTYTITLKASNEIGFGPAATLNRVKLASEVPNPVTNLVCNTTGTDSIELSWDVPLSTCIIQYYQIDVNTNVLWGSITEDLLNITTIRGRYVLNEQTPYTNYTFSVQPGTEAGMGTPVSCTFVTPQAAPGAPSEMHVSDKSTSELDIEWQTPEERNGILTSYHIYLDDEEIDTVDVASDDLTRVYSYTIKDLDDDVVYKISVAAQNSAGIGAAAPDTGTTDKNNLGVILGTVIPLVVIIIVAIAGVWYYSMSKKKKVNVTTSDD